MTEQEWLASEDPAAMLAFITGSGRGTAVASQPLPSDRKLRLFACACVRQVWHLLTDERSRKAVEVAERMADDAASNDEVADARYSVSELLTDPPGSPQRYAELMARDCLGDFGPDRVWHHSSSCPVPPAAQAALLREVVGDPFRPVTLCGYSNHGGKGTLSWCEDCKRLLTPQVLSLTQAAYDERQNDGTLDPVRLSILADALEEAGCVDEATLMHLRGRERCPCAMNGLGPTHGNDEMCGGSRWVKLPGPHVRGCWALDIILGRQ